MDTTAAPADPTRQRRLDAWLIGAALAALALLIVLNGWAWRVDRLLYDIGLSLSTRPATADVVIVAIDEASVAAIGRWPWRRAVHTTLLQRLAEVRPRAILLDLVLSEADPDPHQDQLLADALRAAPVVLPLAWYALPAEPPRLLLPAGPMAQAARLAQAEIEPDADGIVRHTFLRAGIATASRPHVALAMLDLGGEAPRSPPWVERAPRPAADADGAWVRDQRLPIRFQGPAGHLPTVSYVDVLSGAVPAEALRGKYLLVGMTALGLGDSFATPMIGERGAMPGVELIGQTLHALRSGDTLRSPPDGVTGLASALAVLLLVAALSRLPTRHGLAAALALAFGSVLASIALVGAGWWITPVGLAPAALLAYPLWSWRRLEGLAAGLDRELQLLDADAPAAPSARPPAAIDRRLSAIGAATERLRRSRRFLAASLDALPEAVLLADGEARVTLANRRAAALFEVDEPADLDGLDLARLLGELGSPDSLDWPTRLADVLARQSTLVVQARLAGHGDLLVHIGPAPGADGPRLIATCADITSLVDAERAREEALAFVSHDLRSPVSSIQMLTELHQRGIGAMPTDRLVGEIRHLAARALELSEAFVQAAQGEGKPIDWTDGDLVRLVADALREVAPQAAARGVSFELAGADSARARFDRDLLARAVGNLLTNAVKFSPSGERVTVDVSRRPAGHAVTVQDRGVGMDAAQLSTLFQPWSRGHGQSSRAGFGLGLQFVQRVAERHGGWVRADSQPGQGSRFELFIPAAASRAAEVDGEVAPTATPESGNP